MSLRSVLTTLLGVTLAGTLAAPLAGCLVAAVGAAGAGGGYAMSQERSFSDTARDAGIAAVVGKS